MKYLPFAIDIADKLIKDNPDLFKDCTDTKMKITVAMIEFAKDCVDFLYPEEQTIKTELQSLTKTTNS